MPSSSSVPSLSTGNNGALNMNIGPLGGAGAGVGKKNAHLHKYT